MKSPLNNSNDVSLEQEIPINQIVDFYKKTYNIDVGKYFHDLDNISIYRCNESGYRFYYPLNVAGDSDFYIHFQQYDWYYMPWKWEHDICSDLIKPNQRILEVGCGTGSFLKRIRLEKEVECVGLELNEDSTFESSGIKIENTTIEEYSLINSERFDIVCSFQVLEHIPQVNSFIKSQVDCLNKNGLLIICVPNNDSFIRYEKHKLNMPPHHMGLWNESSLRSLENYFNIKFKKIIYEPLQPYHFSFYAFIMMKRYIGGYLSKIAMFLLVSMKLNKLINKYLAKRANLIKGHSIMITFEKI